MANQKKAHIAYFDFLRGIAILMVIAIHCYTISTNIYSNVWYCEIAIRQVFNCAVPIFLAISGYFLSKSSKSSKDLIIKQIKQIYLPTLIWSIPYFILYIKEGGNPIKGILMLFVCGFSIYYFIALIFQCYALSPLLKKVKLGGGNYKWNYYKHNDFYCHLSDAD